MIIFDLLLSFLLITAIWYSYTLHKRIDSLQQNKIEFTSTLKEFESAIVRAEISVNELNSIRINTQKNIENSIEKAKILSDDLSFISDIGADIASKLEEVISNAQKLRKEIPLNKGQEELPVMAGAANNYSKEDIDAILTMVSRVKS